MWLNCPVYCILCLLAGAKTSRLEARETLFTQGSQVGPSQRSRVDRTDDLPLLRKSGHSRPNKNLRSVLIMNFPTPVNKVVEGILVSPWLSVHQSVCLFVCLWKKWSRALHCLGYNNDTNMYIYYSCFLYSSFIHSFIFIICYSK